MLKVDYTTGQIPRKNTQEKQIQSSPSEVFKHVKSNKKATLSKFIKVIILYLQMHEFFIITSNVTQFFKINDK